MRPRPLARASNKWLGSTRVDRRGRNCGPALRHKASGVQREIAQSRFHGRLTPSHGFLWLVALLLCTSLAEASATTTLRVWYTYAAGTADEAIFLRSIEAFEAANPDIDVDATAIPYLQNLAQFINASQGGEAPDVLRVSDTEVGKLGHITVDGLPLLEDLRAHLTPDQRARSEPRSLTALRYGPPLYAIPASQGCLSLIYNRSLFDQAGLGYPQDDWTTDDLLAAARTLTDEENLGLALPLKWSYWLMPIASGFGGWPFDEAGNPTLDAPGMASALDWFLDLDRVHNVATAGTPLEGMSTLFLLEKTGMIFDGAWNLESYRNEGLDFGQALLPVVAETGHRMGPMFSYFGWAVSKQSEAKVEAVDLALWLTSAEVQKEFALTTYTVPTDRSVMTNPEVLADPMLAGYLRQVSHGRAIPTNRAAVLFFEQLDTALELVFTGEMTAEDALAAADAELEKVLSQ